MFAFFKVISVCVTLCHTQRIIGSHHDFHGAVKSAWGQSPGRPWAWTPPSTGVPGTPSTSVKGALGTYTGNGASYQPPTNSPPPRGRWGAAPSNPLKGSAPYPAPFSPPPLTVPCCKPPVNPTVSAPYPGPSSPRQGFRGIFPPSPPYSPAIPTGGVNRIGGDQENLQSPRPAASTSECRAGGEVYKVGDKWTPEGACARHACLDGGKTSILGCPDLEASPDCFLSGEDPRQPWPTCCPQLQCDR